VRITGYPNGIGKAMKLFSDKIIELEKDFMKKNN